MKHYKSVGDGDFDEQAFGARLLENGSSDGEVDQQELLARLQPKKGKGKPKASDMPEDLQKSLEAATACGKNDDVIAKCSTMHSLLSRVLLDIRRNKGALPKNQAWDKGMTDAYTKARVRVHIL